MKNVLALMFSLALLPVNFSLASDEKEVPATNLEQEVSFSYFNFNAYYSCSYVEGVAYKILADLGATDVEVDCQGGLPDTTGNWVTTRFLSARETTADKSTRTAKAVDVGIELRESCDLHDTIVREVAKGFDVKAFSKKGVCWDSAGNASYKLKVLR
jgi:hypothetical protein